ncbi:putative membrane protein [Clostridioides difficile DA00215]|nr:hypothetical protein [Clostridioides difficile]EQH30804.1 putative membrane protein [Clostridioides difficile DA00215]
MKIKKSLISAMMVSAMVLGGTGAVFEMEMIHLILLYLNLNL